MGVLDLFRLDGQVALVTGAGRGIGRVYALALAEAGADVAVVELDEPTGRQVAEEVAALGRRSVYLRCDVRRADEVEAMVAAVVAQLGGLDIAVNNAFSGSGDWYAVVDSVLNSVFVCARAESAVMVPQQHGRIINTASISGTVANCRGEGGAAYCASKAGVIMLTKCLAADLAPHNITVNCISPTYALSPVKRTESVEDRARIRALHPLGWYERPDDLCGTLVYLASDAAAYVTGRDHIVDGGHTLNVWLQPPPRVAPPLVSLADEVVSLRHDLDQMGIAYDEHVVSER